MLFIRNALSVILFQLACARNLAALGAGYCLTLSVSVPADFDPSSGEKLPVIVWSHGGAFVGGATVLRLEPGHIGPFDASKAHRCDFWKSLYPERLEVN